MIERKFINQNIKEFEIKEYIRQNLSRVGLSDVKLQRTPLGEKIIISTSRPGLVVGRSGSNIAKLTKDLKQVFKLENPQIEIEEVGQIGLDANIIAEMIANSLEKFGIARFKGIGHKAMQDVMNAGAFGIEILISGKIPSARAKSWRFYTGYLKKCGDIAVSKLKVAYAVANIKTGTIGIKVSIMTPDTVLPDKMKVITKEELERAASEPVTDKAVAKEMAEKTAELSEEKEHAGGHKKAEKEKAEKSDKAEKSEKKKQPAAKKKQASPAGKKKTEDAAEKTEEAPVESGE